MSTMHELSDFCKWISEYPGYWQIICNQETEPISPDAIANVISELFNKGYYELILVTLQNNVKDENVKFALFTSFLEAMQVWTQENFKGFVQKILRHLT